MNSKNDEHLRKVPFVIKPEPDPEQLDANGNTRIEDVPFDEPFLAWVNGGWLTRFYRVRYCEHVNCNNQILPKYRKSRYNTWNLTTITEAKKSRYCSQECANNARRKPPKIQHGNKKKVNRRIEVKISDKEAILNNFLWGSA